MIALLWSGGPGSSGPLAADDRARAGRGGAGAGHGAVWVVLPAQGRRLRGLVAPHVVGSVVEGAWSLQGVEVGQRGWSYELVGPVGVQPTTVRLTATLRGSGWDDHPTVVWGTEPAEAGLPAEARRALEALRAAAQPRLDGELLRGISALRGERGPPPASREPGAVSRGLSPDLATWLMLLLAAAGLALAVWRDHRTRAGTVDVQRLLIHWAPALVLLLGLWVRSRGVPLASFAADEVGFFETTQRIVLEGRWPVLGPQVSGGDTYHPGGLFYWIMAIPAALGRDPRLAGLFTALLSVAGLALMTRLVRDTRGWTAALLFAWLAALSPWLTVHGDRLDNSSVSVWLGAVALYGLHRMQQQARSRWIAPVIVSLAVLPQLHLSAPVLWGVAVGQLLLWRPALNLRAAGVGLFVAAALNTPYLLWEAGHGFSNTLGLLDPVPGAAATHESPARSGLAYLFVMGTGHVDYLFQHEFAHLPEHAILWQLGTHDGLADTLARYGPWVSGVIGLSAVLAALGWMRGLAGGATRLRRDPVMTALLLGGLTAVVLLAWRGQRAYPHYVNLLLPVALVPLVDGLLLPLRLSGGRAVATTVTTLAVVLGLTFGVLGDRYYRQVEAPAGIATTVGVAEIITSRQQDQPFHWISDQPTPDGLRAVAGRVLGSTWPDRADARTRYRAVLGESTAPDDRRWWVPPIWVEELPR